MIYTYMNNITFSKTTNKKTAVEDGRYENLVILENEFKTIYRTSLNSKHMLIRIFL